MPGCVKGHLGTSLGRVVIIHVYSWPAVCTKLSLGAVTTEIPGRKVMETCKVVGSEAKLNDARGVRIIEQRIAGFG